MKKISTVLIIFVCCLVCTVKGQVSDLSLTDCIALAIKNNPTLKQGELQVSRADLYYKQAKYNRLPNLNGNISHDLTQGRSIDPTTNQYIDKSNSSGRQSLNLSLPIFNGFAILHDIRMRSNAKDAGKLEFEGQLNELKLNVIEAYIKVLTAQDMLKQTEGQLTVTKEQLQRSEIMHREGNINPGDFYDLKGQYSAELNILEQTKQSLNNARVSLAALLNIAPEDLPGLRAVDTAPKAQTQSAKELFEKSLFNMPNYKAMDWRIKEMEESVKLAKADYFPSLSLSGGMSTNYSREGGSFSSQYKNNLYKGIGLNLSIPIFNKFQTRTQVRLAEVNLASAELDREILKNELRSKTAQAVFDLAITQENLQNLREQELNYTEAFRISTVHFEAGNSNSVLFLTAKNKLDAVKSQLIIKEYEWLMQKYINDYYAGSLDL